MSMDMSHTPAELRPTEAALDSLARAEREAAPATLEARIFVATRGLLPGSAPVVFVRRATFLTRMRVAASVAIVGGVAALWLAQGGTPAAPAPRVDAAALEADVNFILAMKSEGLANTRESIDTLYLEADALAAAFKKYDTLPLVEGSM